MADHLRAELASDLSGVYLHGSLVLGDFVEIRSDIDVVALTARRLSADEKRNLGARLSQRSLPCPAVGGLEFHLLHQDSLLSIESPPFELHISTSTQGEPDRVVDGHSLGGDTDLVMHFAVLRKHGRALLGPPPGELFPAVPRQLLLEAFLGELAWARKHASPSYLVLNACRAWRYAEEGVICSKTGGAEWAQLRADSPSAIETALRHRRGLTDDHANPKAALSLVDAVEQRLQHPGLAV